MPNPIDEERKPLSVSEAMAIAKGALESCTLTLVGEVSELSNKAGYKAVYFTVKDEQASLPAMMWMNRYHAAGVELRIGSLVQITGRFTLYAPKGRMNFDVFSLALAGEGDLRQKVANLAKKLQSEGLMDASRKQALPVFPQRIGLVTSPRGAAVHEVLRTLRRRYPLGQVLLAGVPVEGAAAPEYLSKAIATVVEGGAEVVLLVRGGGSFEDLMPFNDENLARTIASCPIPVVTGIGHEPDTSIADMVADLRASTPTAAAESVAPDKLEIYSQLHASAYQMSRTLGSRLERSKSALEALSSRPVLSDPTRLFATEAQSLDFAFDRLQRALPGNIDRDNARLTTYASRLRALGPYQLASSYSRLDGCQVRMLASARKFVEPYSSRIATAASRLEDLSPLSVLARGYALAKDEEGKPITSIDNVNAGDSLSVTVANGTIQCRAESTEYAQTELVSWKD